MNCELWLDESGNFEEGISNDKASFIGGVLFEKSKLNDLDIDRILGREYVHSNEIDKKEFGDFSLSVLDHISNLGGQIVIFENSEKRIVIDGSTTYLNVISDGLVKFIIQMMLKYDEFNLKVLISNRICMEVSNYYSGEVIMSDEYIMRIEEKLILGLMNKSVIQNTSQNYSIEMASARKDRRLMIADVVCHSYYSRLGNKYNASQRGRLDEILSHANILTTLDSHSSLRINEMIIENQIDDAIYILMTNSNTHNIDDFLEPLKKRMGNTYQSELKLKLMNLSNKMKKLIKYDRNYILALDSVSILIDKIIPLLDDVGYSDKMFLLDTLLFKLTIETHIGDIFEADSTIDKCENIINDSSSNWEALEYFFMLKNRKSIHLINTFKFDDAVDEISNVIDATEQMLEALILVNGLEKMVSNLKYLSLGKAYGTRVQAYTYQFRENKCLYDIAVKDSENSIEHLTSEYDINRQYLYRAQLECEAGKFNVSEHYLLESLDITNRDDNRFLKHLNKCLSSSSNIYSLMHFVRLMAERCLGNQVNESKGMYEAIKVNYSQFEEYIENNINEHPLEIIYWKMGMYNALVDNTRSATSYYDKALECCFGSDVIGTLYVIGLAICSEKASTLISKGGKYLKEGNIAFNELRRRYKKLDKYIEKTGLLVKFKDWKYRLDSIEKENDSHIMSEKLWELSREVTY